MRPLDSVPSLPDLVHLSAVPGKEPIASLTLFRAYGELISRRPSYRYRYDALLDQFMQRYEIRDNSCDSCLHPRNTEIK